MSDIETSFTETDPVSEDVVLCPQTIVGYVDRFQSMHGDLTAMLRSHYWSLHDAEDLLQETAADMFGDEKMLVAKYRPPKPFEAWVRTVVINRSIDERRHRERTWVTRIRSDVVTRRDTCKNRDMVIAVLAPEDCPGVPYRPLRKQDRTTLDDLCFRESLDEVLPVITAALEPEMAENFELLLEDWSYEDIAELRDIKLNTLRTQMNYRQRALRCSSQLIEYFDLWRRGKKYDTVDEDVGA